MTTSQLKEKWWAFAFMALSSCGSADDQTGNLGNGSFSYVCVSADDPACANATGGTGTTGASPSNFPAAVASGAHFKVTYQANDSTQGGDPSLKPVAPEYISALSADGSLTALKPGIDDLVARSSVNGLVFDYTEIVISPISSLAVTSAGAPLPTTVQLSVSGSERLVASVLGPHNEQLAGGIDYTWTSSDPTIVSLGEGNPTALNDVTGVKAGNATLTVTAGDPTQGGMKVTIPITVTQ